MFASACIPYACCSCVYAYSPQERNHASLDNLILHVLPRPHDDEHLTFRERYLHRRGDLPIAAAPTSQIDGTRSIWRWRAVCFDGSCLWMYAADVAAATQARRAVGKTRRRKVSNATTHYIVSCPVSRLASELILVLKH